MAYQLLSAKTEAGSLLAPTYNLPFFHSLHMFAYGADPRRGVRPAIPEKMEVQITIDQRDIHWFLSVEELSQRIDEKRRSFPFRIPTCGLASAEWSQWVSLMLRDFDVSPDTHHRVLQTVPPFLHDAMRKALKGRFCRLVVEVRVWQMVKHVALNGSNNNDDDNGEDEESCLFDAAMAGGTIRTVQVREGGVCAICHDDFLAGMEVSELRCSHVFHSCCISRWLNVSFHRLLQASRCPICRHVLID